MISDYFKFLKNFFEHFKFILKKKTICFLTLLWTTNGLSYETIKVERDGKLGLIKLNRPKVKLLTKLLY